MTSTLSNDIASEATGPFKAKFHLWHPWAGPLKADVFFMKVVFLVLLLWHLRVSIDVKWKNLKMAFIAKLLQIFGREFYRNIP